MRAGRYELEKLWSCLREGEGNLGCPLTLPRWKHVSKILYSQTRIYKASFLIQSHSFQKAKYGHFASSKKGSK